MENTPATSDNTQGTLVLRDASGNFAAGTITADVVGNLTGTASAIADNSVTSAKIVDGTIVNADINASAAIDLNKLATGALPTAITVASANIVDGTIVNDDISASAGIVDTKLATIATAGKVSNSATTATSANTANAIVSRDASGNFAAGSITTSGGVGIGTASPNAAAALDVTSTSRGILPPRMTETQRNAISSPPAGLVIYNTTFSKLQVFAGIWTDLHGNAPTASAWQTARDLSLTGDVTATLSSVDGSTNVSAAATIGTSAVTAGKLASNAVETAKINNAAVTAEKLSGEQTGTAPVFGCRAWVNFDGTLTNVTGNNYSRVGTTVTVTRTAHGLNSGNRLVISSATDTGLNTVANTASREISVTGANTFTFQTNSTGASSGTLTYARGIRAAGNVSSVLRDATGEYTITFENAMPDENYAVSVLPGDPAGGSGLHPKIVSPSVTSPPSLMSTTQVKISVNAFNSGIICVIVIR